MTFVVVLVFYRLDFSINVTKVQSFSFNLSTVLTGSELQTFIHSPPFSEDLLGKPRSFYIIGLFKILDSLKSNKEPLHIIKCKVSSLEMLY